MHFSIDFPSLGKSQNDSINAVQFGNDILTDNQEIARQFNDFFIDGVVEINESIDTYCE
jgi:hypothetical protein